MVPTSLFETKHTLNLFHTMSGLKINFAKSHLFGLGPLTSKTPNYFSYLGFSICNDSITYLGITFTHHHDDFFRLNYLPKLSRLKKLLLSWSSRDLTPIGRIHIIKSFAISQIVYLLSVLPNPPDTFFNDLNSLFFKFIWGNKTEKIKREVLCGEKQHGGLNMINIKCFSDGLKCKWVNLYLDNSERNWKAIFDDELIKYGSTFLFHCNFSKGDVIVPNLFIQNICDAWATYSFHPPDEDVYYNQCVLNNHFIKIDNKLYYNKYLKRNNAFRVYNFINEHGTPISYNDFVNVFNINMPFTIYLGIIHAIPTAWKRPYYHHTDVTSNNQNLISFLSSTRPSKLVYSSLSKSNIILPKSINKWENSNILISTNWSSIFMLPFRTTKYSKIQYFQFRILHRIIGLNNLLFKMKLVNSPLCCFCNHETETIEHFFCKCHVVKKFWQDCVSLISIHDFNFNDDGIIFGYFDIKSYPINLFLLHAKHYIYSCKQNNTRPNVRSFQHKFAFIVKVESFILKDKHHDRYNALQNAFVLP